MVTYSLEEAKSGRAGCRKCKEKIGKGDLRIGTHTEVDDHTMSQWQHLECYKMNKKLAGEYTNVQFLEEMVDDNTEESRLGTQEGLADIAEKMGGKADAAADEKKAAKKSGKRTGPLAGIQANAAALLEDGEEDEDEQPAARKSKLDPKDELAAKAYTKYSSFKVGELKDVLRWNHSAVGGTKDVLLLRVIDGEVHGRLARCPTCDKGKLKVIDEDPGKVECKGFFHKESGAYHKCFNVMGVDQAPR